MRYVLAIKSVKTWLLISVSCLIFSVIYEMFSFGVISVSMLTVFVYPLILGALVCFLIKGNIGRFYNDGVIMLSFASLINGILEIYGTDTPYTRYMVTAGIILMILQICLNCIKRKRSYERRKKRDIAYDI